MKDSTLEQIQEEVRKAVYFIVLADESKDTSKKEQVVVAVRYCLNNSIHEEFVGIAEAQSLDADGLTDTIISHGGLMLIWSVEWSSKETSRKK